MNRLKHFIEWQVFGGVYGNRRANGHRHFPYPHLVHLYLLSHHGLPLIVYFILAFWMNIKRYILSARRNPLKYL